MTAAVDPDGQRILGVDHRLHRGLAEVSMRNRNRNRNRRGISLVEVMVTIAIVLTLMSLMAYGVFTIFAQSRVQTTLLTLGKVAEQIEVYTLSHRRPPTESEGLAVLPGKPPNDSW